MRALLQLMAITVGFVVIVSAILTGCTDANHFGAYDAYADDVGAPVRGHPDGGSTDATLPLDTAVAPDAADAPPTRPLGSGCTENGQCGSGVCTREEGASAGMCCDRPNDSCNTCVGGYVVPAGDNIPCGGGTTTARRGRAW